MMVDYCCIGQVARLQEQLQTERDLRAALEIGLSMSAAHLSGSQSLDSKVRLSTVGDIISSLELAFENFIEVVVHNFSVQEIHVCSSS
jgi:hypothetical protein